MSDSLTIPPTVVFCHWIPAPFWCVKNMNLQFYLFSSVWLEHCIPYKYHRGHEELSSSAKMRADESLSLSLRLSTRPPIVFSPSALGSDCGRSKGLQSNWVWWWSWNPPRPFFHSSFLSPPPCCDFGRYFRQRLKVRGLHPLCSVIIVFLGLSTE